LNIRESRENIKDCYLGKKGGKIERGLGRDGIKVKV
jgi:hypothetical protein